MSDNSKFRWPPAFMCQSHHSPKNFFVAMMKWKMPRRRASGLINPVDNETDHLALLAFKSKIVHDPERVMDSWNNYVHFCNWQGVTCGKRHRRVTILDLQARRLVGFISPYIGNLSFLRVLRLNNNTFQGEIPPQVAIYSGCRNYPCIIIH